ncbi:MAG TPA: RcpC/CpaB family pilus assembly protein [Bacillota bacterium]|nr:RcpC/CpaB family pilus assembly protein [Bacillota bacterium]
MEPIAKTCVQHVKVLDVRDEGARKLSDSDSQPKKDQQSQVISGSNRKLVPHAVLLAVTPQQAEQIVLYQKLGEITLSVNPQGSKAFTSGGVRLSSLGM